MPTWDGGNGGWWYTREEMHRMTKSTKVLFISAANSPDMSANFLWDGLQTLLGANNVVDGVGGDALQGSREGKWANSRPLTYHKKHRVARPDEDNFDLIVATSTFLRDHDWEWLKDQKEERLKKGGKLVWFETLDGAKDICNPPFQVDAVFRREIDPAVQYPYEHKPLSLLCAVPERWFADPLYGWTDQKPYDVFNVSNCVTTGHPTRWSSLSPTFCTSKRYHTLAGAGVLQPNTVYLHVARNFKLIVDGPGAEGASDNGRTWETISMGGIPLFIEQQCRPRWPWFTGEHCFWCEHVEQLPAAIEQALEHTDLDAMRLRLKEHTLEWHTTEKRAAQFFQMIEEDAWLGAHGPWRW